MKYYVYVSDAKIEMLCSQIPRSIREQIAAELKIDLKLISVSLKERKVTQETRYSKAGLVAAYIEGHERLGTVDAPEGYIKDALPMRWGPYGGDNRLVYFGGGTKHTIVGLGGSAYNLLGHQRGASEPHAHSTTSTIIAAISRDLDADEVEHPLRSFHRGYRPEGTPQSAQLSDAELEDRTANETLIAVSLATSQMKGPVQRLEFLAKRLYEGHLVPNPWDSPRERAHVLLASPIYVALLD